MESRSRQHAGLSCGGTLVARRECRGERRRSYRRSIYHDGHPNIHEMTCSASITAQLGMPSCPGRASASERRSGTQGSTVRFTILRFATLTLGPGSRFARARALAPLARDTSEERLSRQMLVEEAGDLAERLLGLRCEGVEIVLRVRHALEHLQLGLHAGAPQLAVGEHGEAQELDGREQ